MGVNDYWEATPSKSPSGFADWGQVLSTTVDLVNGQDVNPLEFGVVGDGEADDTADMQAAISVAASAGKALVVPPGNYKMSSITLTSGARLRMLPGATFRLPTGATQSRIIVIDGSDVVIDGVVIDGEGIGSSADGLIFCSALGLSDISIMNCTLKNASRHAIRLANTAGNISVVDNTILGYDTSGGGGCGVSMISNTAGAPAEVRNVRISGNTVKRSATGDGHGIQIRGANDHTREIYHARIVDNHCDLKLGVSGGSTKGAIESWALHASVVGNTTRGGNMGISNGRSHTTISGNSISETSGNGIEASAGQGSNITCSGNAIKDVVIGVSAWGSGTECAIVGNSIEGATLTGINANAPDSVTVGNRVNCAAGALVGIDTNLTGLTSNNQVLSANYVKMHAATASTVGMRITNTSEFTCNSNVFVDADTGLSLTGTLVAKNGTIVGNDFTNAGTAISKAGTLGQIQEWANRGVLPSIGGNVAAMLIAQGVAQA